MPAGCNAGRLEFERLGGRKVTGSFHGGTMTSKGWRVLAGNVAGFLPRRTPRPLYADWNGAWTISAWEKAIFKGVRRTRLRRRGFVPP